MRPCIILARPAVERVNADHYDAFNEDGRKLISTYSYRNMVEYLKGQEFEPVSLNSRCGRTILDKLENQRL